MRLIDADELLNAFSVIKEDKQVSLYGAAADFMVMIFAMPTIDAVPVVRCKDCRYSGFDPEYGKRWCERCWGSMLVQDDDFCSYGEKREDRHE